MDCIFCKFAKQEIPKEFLYEDDDVMAFYDIHPVRKVHVLVIPKNHISELVVVEDPGLFQKLFTVVQKMIKQEGLTDKGYRVVINGGGAQMVHHLHIHVTGPVNKTAKM